MKTINYYIIVTALIIVLGSVDVYAGPGQSRLVNSGSVCTKKEFVDVNLRLVEAILDNNIDGVHEALWAGAHVNLSIGFYTPLLMACRNRHFDIVALLLRYGADVNRVERDGETPLVNACWRGDATIVELLLNSGANVNQPGRFVDTPLLAACREGHSVIVGLLLNHGANPNQDDNYFDTPLLAACRKGHAGILKRLAFHGVTLSGNEMVGKYARGIIQRAQVARRKVGDGCLTPRDVQIVVKYISPVEDVRDTIRSYLDPFVGVQDHQLQALIIEQTLKNRKRRFAQERLCAQANVAEQERPAKQEVKDEERKDYHAVQVMAQALDDQRDGDAPGKLVCRRSVCVLL